ncbi:RNA polymerase II elongation factor [Ceratobasidium sp. 394]|nr:RNA polymerase II elongation factor [Ceratobasidium sp. 394]
MDATEVKKLIKELQTTTVSGKPEATTEYRCLQDSVTILKQLKQHVVATEDLLRETKAGLAIGKLRTHARKEIADLAKELVKKWKEAVEAEKKARAAGAPAADPAKPLVKTDAVKIESKGDKARDKCLELLYDAMAMDSGAPTEQILKRAYAIEYSVHKEFDGVSKEYSQKMRRLCMNLKDKKNPGLRAAVVSGDIQVERFCKMTPEEMASEERKQKNNEINQQNVHNALGAGEPEAETDAFQCGRCKNYKTRYRQAQTRSADEPMTLHGLRQQVRFSIQFSALN